jgi:hypothetical protein
VQIVNAIVETARVCNLDKDIHVAGELTGNRASLERDVG